MTFVSCSSRGLPAQVVVSAPGFAPLIHTASGLAGEEPRIDLGVISLDPGARLRARFRLEGVESAEEIVVIVSDPESDWSSGVRARVDGAWEDSSLPPGRALALWAWASWDDGRRWSLKRALSLKELRAGDLGEVVIPRR